MTAAAVLHTRGLSAKSSEPNHGEGGYAARPRQQNQSIHPNLKLSEELQSPHFFLSILGKRRGVCGNGFA